MADTTKTVDLDSTIALLQQGLVSIDPEAALNAIEAWQEQLAGTELAEPLGELKLAIDGGVRSGEISAILAHLGSQTKAAAQTQEGDNAAKLQQLGEVLSTAFNTAK